jgi:hypothetical protein
MAEEGTIRDRARAARSRRWEAYLRERLEQDRRDHQRVLPLVNRLLNTQLTVDDLPQSVAQVAKDRDRVEYRFQVDGETFTLTGDGSLHVLRKCSLCNRLAESGTISMAIDAAILETGGDQFDLERTLEELADLLEAEVHCWYHRQPEEPEYSELEARVRQLIRDEIDKAGLADDEHDHSGFADEHHVHYELADRSHDHDDSYASTYHSH